MIGIVTWPLFLQQQLFNIKDGQVTKPTF